MAQSEGSFVRWQAITITQFGYAVNLMLAFAAASLGFALTLVKDQHFVPGCWGRALLVISALSLIVSLSVGVWCVINRLHSFRTTERIARERICNEPGQNEELEAELAQRRTKTKNLDRRTWCLLYCQIGTFGFGVLMLVFCFAIAYRAKLF